MIEKLKPVGNYLVVKVKETPKKTAGGLHLPTDLSSRTIELRGEVMSLGPTAFKTARFEYNEHDEESGVINLKQEPPRCTLGDYVLFRRNSGYGFEQLKDNATIGSANTEDWDYCRLIRDEDVIAVFTSSDYLPHIKVFDIPDAGN